MERARSAGHDAVYSSIAVTATDAAGNRSTFWVWVSPVYRYSLAEGATGAFFDFDLLLSNAEAVTGTLTFLRENGALVVMPFEAHTARVTAVRVDNIPGLEEVAGISTVVEANGPLAVERTMYFNARHYGAHTGTAVDGPGTRWLFAEGAEGTFHTFVLLANTGAAASTATVRFLRDGAPPVTRTVNVPPTSRVTLATSGIAELANKSFSMVVTSDGAGHRGARDVLRHGPLFNGAHESAGVNAAGATEWFLAEGATGAFFDTYVLVGNPNADPATVTLTYLLASGVSITRVKTVPGQTAADGESRGRGSTGARRGGVDDGAGGCAGDRPSGRCPGRARRATWAEEAHNSFGVTEPRTKWGLAEGRSGAGR